MSKKGTFTVVTWHRDGFDLIGTPTSYILGFPEFPKIQYVPLPLQGGKVLQCAQRVLEVGREKSSAGFGWIKMQEFHALEYIGLFASKDETFALFKDHGAPEVEDQVELARYKAAFFAFSVLDGNWFWTTPSIAGRVIETAFIRICNDDQAAVRIVPNHWGPVFHLNFEYHSTWRHFDPEQVGSFDSIAAAQAFAKARGVTPIIDPKCLPETLNKINTMNETLTPLPRSDAPPSSGTPLHIPRAKIRINPQIRQTFPEKEMQELRASIREVGILQPLIVRALPVLELREPDMLEHGWRVLRIDVEPPVVVQESHPDQGAVFSEAAARHYLEENSQFTHELVCGERRYRASEDLIDPLPCLVRAMTDAEVLKIQLIENVNRADLAELEEAHAYQQLREKLGLTLDEIAAQTGKKKSTIDNRLSLLTVAPAVRQSLEAGDITPAHVYRIKRVQGWSNQVKVLERVLEDGPLVYDDNTTGTEATYIREPMSTRQLEILIKNDFTLDLRKATFALDDGTLLAGRVFNAPPAGHALPVDATHFTGSCLNCPMRSGTTPELYPEIKSEMICLSPQCYKAKTQAHLSNRVEAYRKEGCTILTPAENFETFVGHLVRLESGYVRAIDICSRDTQHRTFKELLDHQLPTYLGQDKEGNLVKLFRLADTVSALRQHPDVAPAQPRNERKETRPERDQRDQPAASSLSPSPGGEGRGEVEQPNTSSQISHEQPALDLPDTLESKIACETNRRLTSEIVATASTKEGAHKCLRHLILLAQEEFHADTNAILDRRECNVTIHRLMMLMDLPELVGLYLEMKLGPNLKGGYREHAFPLLCLDFEIDENAIDEEVREDLKPKPAPLPPKSRKEIKAAAYAAYCKAKGISPENKDPHEVTSTLGNVHEMLIPREHTVNEHGIVLDPIAFVFPFPKPLKVVGSIKFAWVKGKWYFGYSYALLKGNMLGNSSGVSTRDGSGYPTATKAVQAAIQDATEFFDTNEPKALPILREWLQAFYLSNPAKEEEAETKPQAKADKKKPLMTAAARAKLSALAKRRWAKIKARQTK